MKLGRDVLGKGTCGHATAAGADGDPIQAGKRRAENDGRVGLLFAVARQAELIAIEEGAVFGVVGVASPVPVWLVAGVAALGPEGVLVVPDIIPVPWEEKGLWCVSTASWEHGWGASYGSVVPVRLLHMHNDVVVEPALRPRCLMCRQGGLRL